MVTGSVSLIIINKIFHKKEHLLFQVILYHTFANKSRRSLVYHPQLVAVYHQHEVLYIIKPQADTRWRVMRYSPAGADDIHRTSRGDNIPSLRLG